MHSQKILNIACLLVLLSPSRIYAECYIEGYVGGIFGRSHLTNLHVNNIYTINGLTASFCLPTAKLSSTVTGGLKLGAWFDDQCHLPCEIPSWLEHFGCYVDADFNDLDYRHSFCLTPICYISPDGSTHTGRTDICLATTGHSTTLAFMLACRACICRTDELPAGRFQPYLALGPAVLFVKQHAKLLIGAHEIDDGHFALILNNTYPIEPSCCASKHVACAALDTGVRQMLSACLSIDYSFKYRYAPSCFSFAAANGSTGDLLSFKHRYHQFSFQVGLGFHF